LNSLKKNLQNPEDRLCHKKDMMKKMIKKIPAEPIGCAETRAMLDSRIKNIRDGIESRNM
jgi:hypothetical protein